MDNSLQLSTMDKLSVTYQHGTLQTDISNLQTSEVESLEINWSELLKRNTPVVGRKFRDF